MINDLEDRPLTFIVGCPRSGTTWLQLLLAQHPRVATSQETHLFSSYMNPLWTQWRRDAALERPVGLPTLVDEEAFLALCRSFAETSLGRIAGESGRTAVILEKTPDHVFHAEFILRLFPSARFIHLVRDPRAVAASLFAASRSWASDWAPRTAAESARFWIRSTSAGLEIGKLTDRFTEVKYECLLTRPIETLRGLFEFMGLECDEALCQRAVGACTARALKEAQPIARVPESMRGGLSRVARKGVAEGWREELAWPDIVAVESIAHSMMRHYHYAPISTPGQRRWRSLLEKGRSTIWSRPAGLTKGLLWRSMRRGMT
jgi:hypothetical protein